MKKYLLYFALIFASQNMLGQCCPYLETVELQPNMPTLTDSIFLKIKLATPGLGNFLGYNIIETDTLTTVEACYYSGPLTALQDYEDSINLGVRDVGTFKVKFIAWISSNDTICDFIQNQSMELEVNVEGTNSIFSIIKTSKVDIFPNPVQNEILTISSEKDFETIQIFNQQGILISEHHHHLGKIKFLDVKHLHRGVYFIKGISDSKIVFYKKLLKN